MLQLSLLRVRFLNRLLAFCLGRSGALTLAPQLGSSVLIISHHVDAEIVFELSIQTAMKSYRREIALLHVI